MVMLAGYPVIRFVVIAILVSQLLLACDSSSQSNQILLEDLNTAGFDQCEFLGQYNDQVCDLDCPLPDPDCDSGDIRNIDGHGPTMCVALRGNGDRIPAHFAAMARLFETQGLISGMAGGSSAALSALLIESVQKNDAVRCDRCTPQQMGERAALLMKSLFGYIETLSQSEDFIAAQTYFALLTEIDESGLDDGLNAASEQAAVELQTLLESDRFRSLVNPEVFQLLRQSPDPAYHAADLYQGIKAAADFRPNDQSILVRPGLLNFNGLAEQFGRAADFYVETEFNQFLNECSDNAVGRSWPEIVNLPSTGGTCGNLFYNPLGSYLQRTTPSTQLNRPVGEFMHTIITTSVLEGETVSLWRDARNAYLQAQPIEQDYNFADVRFGYFGSDTDLQTILQNKNNYNDEKTRRFRAYGDVTWREALSYSPAEPGLSRALELPDGRVSAGGWNDLHPVLALKNMGCDEVIYVTRNGTESEYARGLSRLLGAQAADEDDLFNLTQSNSGFSRSLQEADGVWCTDWDNQERLNFAAFYEDAYNAPFETTDPALSSIQYPKTSSFLGLQGCSAGVF